MAETSLNLIAQLALVLSISFMVLFASRRRANGVASVNFDASCADIKREYISVERKLSAILTGPRLDMSDLRTICYDVLGVALDDICASGTKRDCAVSLLLSARKSGKLLEVWKSLAWMASRDRKDLLDDL
jgi:hypothetical protein